jgi:hypothetical protein
MASGPRSWLTNKGYDALAGLEAGVIGALVMLAWFAIASPLIGSEWWAIPNLYASDTVARRGISTGPGIPTAVGAAVLTITGGLVGALAGLLRPRGRLVGLGVAIAWFLVSQAFLWRWTAPAVPYYASYPLLIAGFFLYGSVLGWHGHLRAWITGDAMPRRSLEPTPKATQAAAAPSSPAPMAVPQSDQQDIELGNSDGNTPPTSGNGAGLNRTGTEVPPPTSN